MSDGRTFERDTVADEGVQAERTALAWQRTALVLAATAAGVLRLVAYQAGALVTVVCAVVVIAAVALLRVTHRRYLAMVRAILRDVDDDPAAGGVMPGAVLPAVAVAAAIVLGLVEILAVMIGGE